MGTKKQKEKRLNEIIKQLAELDEGIYDMLNGNETPLDRAISLGQELTDMVGLFLYPCDED